jgi:hypothetical protein
LKQLTDILDILEGKIEFKDQLNQNISISDVAWHIDHSLKVINSIVTVLKKSNPNDYKWRFHYKRSFLFLTGTIARGKAKAPKSVQANDVISTKDLKRQLETAKFLINELDDLHAKSNIKHPIIGLLNLNQAKKFMTIHTNHHIKIINDILASKMHNER